jgi:hypothetical protein
MVRDRHIFHVERRVVEAPFPMIVDLRASRSKRREALFNVQHNRLTQSRRTCLVK